MIGHQFIRMQGSKRNLLALLASSAIFTAGCANMATTGSTTNPFTTTATLSGKIHGGNQPISGATVNLYYAGQSGQGSLATLAATTTSSNDGTGSFSFTKNPVNGQPPSGNMYSCPTTTGDPLVYVTATGGNTLNTGDPSVNNTASVFVAAYGLCSQLSSANFVDMSEVTTVATMAALQRYFNPVTESFGADGILVEKVAITNTLPTISNMVDLSTGLALDSTDITGSTASVSGVTVTATPDTDKINLLANILSACINTTSASSGPCTTLFANATPPSDPIAVGRPIGTAPFVPATDVLQALYYIFTNPTNGSTTNLENIFNLASGVGAPYQPSLSTTPSDWTVSIAYNSTNTCGLNNGGFLSSPYDLNVDGQGNLWIANSEAANGNLTEISANGKPVTCAFLNGGSNGGGTIDSQGNVWLATAAANNIYRYKPTDGSVLTYSTATAPLAVTADGQGNVYFSTSSDTSLYQIPGGATATSPTTPIQISSVVGSNPIRLMPDKSGAIWASSGSTFISRVVAATAGSPNFLNGYSTSTFNTLGNSYGLSITYGNNIFTSTTGGTGSLSYFTGAGTAYSLASGWPAPAGTAGLNSPTAVAVDGAQNVWALNSVADPTSGFFAVSGISVGANSLTGTTGLQAGSLTPGRALAIDQSGNIWVAGDGSPSTIVTEIVGGAVPTYQPYSSGLANGRFQTVP
jgi:streptogramin lyase